MAIIACGMASHFWSATAVVAVVLVVKVAVGVGFRGSKIQNDPGYPIMHQECCEDTVSCF